jgi:hypothetical protein
MLSEDALANLCKAHFKGYFVCEGHKLLKMSEDRSTNDDQQNKSQISNNLLMPVGYQRRSSGADSSNQHNNGRLSANTG